MFSVRSGAQAVEQGSLHANSKRVLENALYLMLKRDIRQSPNCSVLQAKLRNADTVKALKSALG